jgi:hypothetical protein
VPFEGRNVTAVGTAIHDGRPPPASHARPELPSSIDAVFARAFHPRLESRFQHAPQFADALAATARDVRSVAAATRPAPAVAISRVRVIDGDGETFADVPFDLVRRVPIHSAGPGAAR